MYTDECRNADFEWYEEHYSELASQYGHSYLGIRDKKVICQGESAGDVIDNAPAAYKRGEYCVQEVDPTRLAYIINLPVVMLRGAGK